MAWQRNEAPPTQNYYQGTEIFYKAVNAQYVQTPICRMIDKSLLMCPDN